MQTVTYNDYEFTYCSVSYGGRMEYDQTDRTLQAVNKSYRVVSNIFGSSVADFEQRLRAAISALNQSRKRFTWKIGSSIIVDVAPPGVGALLEDRRNGPKPRNIDVQKIRGGMSAVVSFTIDSFVSDSPSTSDIEEFWWTFNYSYDRNFTCQRSVQGRIRVRNKMDAPATLANNPQLLPALPFGFYRGAITHNTEADGLVVNFSFTDHQVWRTLPKPLTDGDATYTITQSGATIMKSLRCSFAAPHDVPKQVILQFIQTLVMARFPNAFNQTTGKNNEWIKHYEITNHEFDNRMDCSVMVQTGAFSLVNSTQVATDKKPITGASINLQSLFDDIQNVKPTAGQSWTESNGVAELRGLTGTAKLLPSGQDPFDVAKSTFKVPDNDGTKATKGEAGERGDKSQSPGLGDGLTAKPSVQATSTGQQSYPYVSYVETWSYVLDRNVVRIPVARGPDGNEVAPPDILQRVANPSFKIIQVGHARRLGARPEVPAPAYHDADQNDTNGPAYVTVEEFKPNVPQMIGDGNSIEYSIGWTYVIENPSVRDISFNETRQGASKVFYPLNPQIGTPQTRADWYTDNYLEGIKNGSIAADGKITIPTSIS